MSKHKALELASEIEGIVELGAYGIDGPADRAAAELRAQHALIVQMREALNDAHSLSIGHTATYQFQHSLNRPHKLHQKVLDANAAALAAADQYLGDK